MTTEGAGDGVRHRAGNESPRRAVPLSTLSAPVGRYMLDATAAVDRPWPKAPCSRPRPKGAPGDIAGACPGPSSVTRSRGALITRSGCYPADPIWSIVPVIARRVPPVFVRRRAHLCVVSGHPAEGGGERAVALEVVRLARCKRQTSLKVELAETRRLVASLPAVLASSPERARASVQDAGSVVRAQASRRATRPHQIVGGTVPVSLPASSRREAARRSRSALHHP